MNNRMERTLLTVFLILAGLCAFGVGMRSGNPYLMATPVLIPVLIYGISRPDIVFLFTLTIMNSKLVFPGIPGDLELYHLSLAFTLGVLIVRMLITKENWRSDSFLRHVAALYGCVAFLTMLMRGIGFRLLGSNEAGGMRYIIIYLGVLTLWFIPTLHLRPSSLRKALIGYVLFSFLPVLGEAVLLLTNGAVYQHYYFIKTGFGLDDTFQGVVTGTGARFTSASSLGRALLYLPFFLYPFERRTYKYYIGFSVLALGFILYSGFRSILIAFVFFVATILFSFFRKHWFALLSVFGTLGVTGWAAVVVFFEHLPYGVQRTLSFLPFINASTAAMSDATGSSAFRIGTWEIAVQEIPEYLWLGRGLTYSLREVHLLTSGPYLEGRNFIYGWLTNLHNGPLEVLIYFGIPGVVLFSLFLWRTSLLSVRYLRHLNPRMDLNRIGGVFAAINIMTVGLFLLTVGNPYVTFFNLAMNTTLLTLLLRNSQEAPSDS